MKRTPIFLTALAAGSMLTSAARAECDAPNPNGFNFHMSIGDQKLDIGAQEDCKTGPDGKKHIVGGFHVELPGAPPITGRFQTGKPAFGD